MVCLDTNIFVYLSNGTLDPGVVAKTDIAHASICRIEALGYHKLTVGEEQRISELFQESYELVLSDEVIQKAIAYRRAYNVTLGDAIVAASAFIHNLELWTANNKDFEKIRDVKIVNPFREKH